MERFNSEFGVVEKKYVRNVRYMFPKPRTAETSKKDHLKTNIQVRELFDLTDETEEAAKVQNLCDIVDLDGSDYNQDGTSTTTISELVTNFKNQKLMIFSTCPLCETKIIPGRFESHVDACRGFQQKVEFSLRNIRK